jgi:predicted dienelactone hydrolase
MRSRVVSIALIAVGIAVLPIVAAAKCPSSSPTGSFLLPRYGVGVRTLTIEDATRTTPAAGTFPELPSRTLVVEVWHPTGLPHDDLPRDAPLARGRFPIIVNSPGLLDTSTGEAYLTSHLASRGFIVASIIFPLSSGESLQRGGPALYDLQNQPGDVSAVIDELLRLAKTRASWLYRGVNPRRIGVSGLSFGGGTTLLVAYHPTLRDPRVRAAMALAPFSCVFGPDFYRDAGPPLLVMHGDQDLLLPLADNGGAVYDRAVRSRRTLVELVHGTHVGFITYFTAPSEQSYDSIGCATLVNVAQWGDPTTGLGGAANGIDDITACGLPCEDPIPPNAPMVAKRQHDLTNAAATAFFEGVLHGSKAGKCFLATRLGADNPDVVVSTARGQR